MARKVKPTLRYTFKQMARGNEYWYYRRDGQIQRIHGDYGSPEFHANYTSIHASFEDDSLPHGVGTLAALIEHYKKSPEYKQRAPKTKKDYIRYLSYLEENFGDLKVSALSKTFVKRLRNKYQENPRTADYFVQVISILMNFAIDEEYRTDNPAAGIKRLSRPDGHRPWEESEIQAYRDRWPEDTRERVLFELLLNTGQRSGDMIEMTRADYKDGWLTIKPNKTYKRVKEDIIVKAPRYLSSILDPWLATHSDGVVSLHEDKRLLVKTKTGRPFKVDYFRHFMRDCYNEAGLKGVTTHGLRYTSATILKELGCAWEDIADITGHRTADMTRHYTAKRRRVARTVARLDASELQNITDGSAKPDV